MAELLFAFALGYHHGTYRVTGAPRTGCNGTLLPIPEEAGGIDCTVCLLVDAYCETGVENFVPGRIRGMACLIARFRNTDRRDSIKAAFVNISRTRIAKYTYKYKQMQDRIAFA